MIGVLFFLLALYVMISIFIGAAVSNSRPEAAGKKILAAGFLWPILLINGLLAELRDQ